MHIHFSAANAAGNSLAGAQEAAETALATRRARELRDAGQKLRAVSLESSVSFGDQLQGDAQSTAQAAAQAFRDSVAMAGAVGDGDAAGQVPAESFAQRLASDLQLKASAMPPPQILSNPGQANQVQPIQRVASSRPVSFWA